MFSIKPNHISKSDLAKFDETFNENEFFKTLQIITINKNQLPQCIPLQIIIIQLCCIECDCKGFELKREISRFVTLSTMTFKMFLQHICANIECFPSDIMSFYIYESLTTNINAETKLSNIFVGNVLSAEDLCPYFPSGEIVEIVVRNEGVCKATPPSKPIEFCNCHDENVKKVRRIS
jgi:hypothetical protein